MLRTLGYAILLVMASSLSALAQSPGDPPTKSQDELLKPEELDALVAPIALYPDSLLATVLMASSYPLEVVQAERWVQANPNLKGDAQRIEAGKQSWDESVKSLVAVPDVLAMMGTKLDWTLKLGDAVLAQQADVMDAVQRMRARAQANNKLTTTKEQRIVTSERTGGQQYIAIEQVDPDVLHVPYYDPGVVYGDWPYPAYPPYYFGYPAYYGAGWVAAGLAFGVGWALGRWASGGNYWGGSINWNRNINNININRPRVNPLGGANWQHRPEHRNGVRYNNPRVNALFGDRNIRSGNRNLDFRGSRGNQVLRPGNQLPGRAGNIGNRPHAGNRPANIGNRPAAGHRPSTLPSRGNIARPSTRPSGGARHNAGRVTHHNRAASRPSHRGSVSHRGSGGRQFSRGGGGGRSISRGGGGGRSVSRGGGGGGARSHGGGGGHRGGGGGGRGGGGRRSDINLKHDITLIGHLDNGLGFYRFSYNGSERAYVGVIAQEVQQVMPAAVTRGADGYLRVRYDKLGVPFETYEHWLRTGSKMPGTAPRLQALP